MLLAVVFAVIAAVLFFVIKKMDDSYHIYGEALSGVSVALAIVLTLVIVIMMIISGLCHIYKDKDEAKFKQTYEDLYTQAELGLYENDNDLGKKELANDILKWNKDLVGYRAMKDNIWVGWMFYPMDMDGYEPIPMKFLQERVG